MAVKGQLREMSLPTLVQLLCQEGNPAQLSIRQDESEAVLYFDGGNVVHAAFRSLSARGPEQARGEGTDDQTGEEVVYRILAWEDGEFDLRSGVAPPSRTIETPWSALLMDGLQRHDEERWDTLDIEQIEEGYQMAENLRDILEELGGQIPGFLAAAVVGMDGLGLAQHATSSIDVDGINAQMTLLLKLVDTTVSKLGAGVIEDYLLTTDKAYLLVRFLSDKNYYLGIASDRKAANLGSMRLYGRLYSERLSKAMPR